VYTSQQTDGDKTRITPTNARPGTRVGVITSSLCSGFTCGLQNKSTDLHLCVVADMGW
jgi:hypothetical protein